MAEAALVISLLSLTWNVVTALLAYPHLSVSMRKHVPAQLGTAVPRRPRTGVGAGHYLYLVAFGYGTVTGFGRDPLTDVQWQLEPCVGDDHPRCAPATALSRAGAPCPSALTEASSSRRARRRMPLPSSTFASLEK